jgi:hypothetical protein
VGMGSIEGSAISPPLPIKAFNMDKIQHNSKLWERKGETFSTFIYWCPGCGHAHSIPVGPGSGHSWTFDGNVESPTFSPSVRHFHTNSQGEQITSCHYHVQAGQMAYCGDCKHELNGKTVPMEDIPKDYGW